MSEIKTVTVSEHEREAVESALMARFGEPLADGSSGNSPYSAEGVVYGPEQASARGCRVALAAVCRSHNGAGQYKGRGRWRTVCVCAPKADGEYGVCEPGDRDAEEVGFSGFYVRPWATHEAEEASQGLGLGADALGAALAALGL